jgi:DNA-binding NtrC family response regulator
MIKYEDKLKSNNRDLCSGVSPKEVENVVSEETMSKENGTILVVEDEKGIRDFVGFILKKSGYKILEAFNGIEALKNVRNYKSEISLLITDFYLPGMRGDELALKLLEWYPEMRILYTSGYGFGHLKEHGSVKERINYIGKPFTGGHLLKKIKTVMDYSI